MVMSLLIGGAVLFEALDRGFAVFAAAPLFLLFLLFYKIRVTITPELICISYGIGLFRQEIDTYTIVNLAVVPNRSLAALYNQAPESVVYATDRSGRSVTIPLFEPRQLLEYLRSRGIS
jgi:hypothetical protein